MRQALFAEFIGTAELLTIVVGSGIMGERLADGNTAIALLANALATGFGLYVLISLFGPVSGALFNPAVSLVETVRGRLRPQDPAGLFNRSVDRCRRRCMAGEFDV